MLGFLDLHGLRDMLGLGWFGFSLLDLLAKWHISILSKKFHEIYRKRAPIPAKFEVEHNFLKTHVPSGILKLVSPTPNFTRFLNP